MPKSLVGQTVGVFDVLEEDRERSYLRYLVRCGKCGRTVIQRGQDVLAHAEEGCPDCRAAALWEAKRCREIGRRYGQDGQVVVLDLERGPAKYRGASVALCRCACGREFKTALSRLRSGMCTSCGHDEAEILRRGREISRASAVDGTKVVSLSQKLSKNSSTGVKGVSLIAKGRNAGKYRAYINLRRKQYHLGLYSTLEEAAAARAEAEEEMYGDFIRWYETYMAEQAAREADAATGQT